MDADKAVRIASYAIEIAKAVIDLDRGGMNNGYPWWSEVGQRSDGVWASCWFCRAKAKIGEIGGSDRDRRCQGVVHVPGCVAGRMADGVEALVGELESGS